MHFYTSININYLPKARILAKSVKKFCPDSKFSLVFSDVMPQEIDPQKEPFDEIITIDNLGLPVSNLNFWIYEHTVVELCTAVKGQALVKFLDSGSDKVVYLDPDIAVFQPLDILDKLLDQNDIILTPHITCPEKSIHGVKDNEMSALKHGAFNFGFYAVRNTENGRNFAHWWRDRLADFCYDQIPDGLFTDQKWGDLVPGLFDGVYIWKDPGCNVATWNISNRKITKDTEGKYFVNGQPLKFYHFSGFDSGSQAMMLDKYSDGNLALYELRKWYIDRQEQEEQKVYEKYPSKYNYYDNGELVKSEERILLRNRLDVIDYFKDTDPYITNQNKSYYLWYRDKSNHARTDKDLSEELKIKLERLESQLARIYQSKFGWLVKKIVQ